MVMNKTCKWTWIITLTDNVSNVYEEGYYKTGCGDSFTFANLWKLAEQHDDFKFCPLCGGRIKEVHIQGRVR